MEYSKHLLTAIQGAAEFTKEHNLELCTPETVLFYICDDNDFRKAFINCGGDIDILEPDLYDYITENIDRCSSITTVQNSLALECALENAHLSAMNSGSPSIKIKHFIHGMWQIDDLYAVYYIEKHGISEADLLSALADIEEEEVEEEEDDKHPSAFFQVFGKRIEIPYTGEDDDNDYEDDDDDDDAPSYDRTPTYAMQSFVSCLNDTLGDVNPLIGRQDELERTMQILCRLDKNNALHIGDPGVGKTAVMYGLVKKIIAGDVPEPLKNARVFSFDIGGMLAGTKYRGDFEKRLKKALDQISDYDNPIIYIDEIHNITGAGATGDGSLDAANIIKPYLTDGKIRFVGSTTYEEHKKYFEKSKSLIRRFQNVEIKEPSKDECIKILEGLISRYENFHGVKYANDVIPYAVEMSSKYINERFLPDKAIDLIDEAGAYMKLKQKPAETYEDLKIWKPASEEKAEIPVVDKDIINTVLTKICRVPVETVETENMDGVAGLEEKLSGLIFGQDEAIKQVVNTVKFSKAGLSEENKPLASLLFVGPTGVGKTEIARLLALKLGLKLIRFDMSEYEEKHAVAKLIGSPAGYVGYEEGGLLTEEIRKNPSSVLLLDEIEKAHPDIYNILLQMMDHATLTDNQGRKADFRNVIIIMTSNAGASCIGKSVIGFESRDRDSSVVMEEVKRIFQPEFRNRLDRIVVFNGMDDSMAEKIIGKKLGELADKLAVKNITLEYDKAAADLIKKKGISSEYGAREADRVIRNEIKPLFVDDILFGKLKTGGKVNLSADGDKFVINVDPGIADLQK